jgi:hypothetical protein
LRWPARIPGGRSVEAIAGAIDLLPTLTELAGIKRVGNRPLDGMDLSELILGEAESGPDRLLFASWNGRVSVRTPQHRLDADGRLYDLVADPGQTREINEHDPAELARLTAAVAEWRKEVWQNEEDASLDALDPRPLTVGYREFPITILPARDGEPRGGVQRSSSAPNSSYFVDWTSLDGHVGWTIAVHTTGRYTVTVDYTCPLPDAGSLIALEFQGRRLTGRVEPGWDPPLHTNQDTLPRPPAESQMKDFRTLELGEIDLIAGQGELILRALEMPGRTVMDLRRLTLTLLPATP